MIGRELRQSGSFWSFLLSVDTDLAESARRQGCSCGGRLHCANYREHREVGPGDLPDEYRYRFSFCCDRDGCRKRVTPPSVRVSRQKSLPWCRRHPIGRHAAGNRPRGGSASFPGCSMSIQQPSLDGRRSSGATTFPGRRSGSWPCSPRACCRDRRPAAIARRGVRAGQRSLSGLGAALAILSPLTIPSCPSIDISRWQRFPAEVHAPKVLIKRLCSHLETPCKSTETSENGPDSATAEPEFFADRLEPRSRSPQPIAA